jgi:hypothetical protein
MLINILKRAKELVKNGNDLFATPSFKIFLSNNFTKEDFLKDETLLNTFAELDDSDITICVKVWSKHGDKILSSLCMRMITRKLFKIILQNTPFEKTFLDELKEKIKTQVNVNDDELNYFILTGTLVNNAYNSSSDKINILFKDGNVRDIAEAADTLNIKSLSEPVEKYFVCYPK